MKYKKQQWDKRDNVLESLNKKDFKKIKMDYIVANIFKLYNNKYLILDRYFNTKNIRLGIISEIICNYDAETIYLHFRNNKKIITIQYDEEDAGRWCWWEFRGDTADYDRLHLSLNNFYERIKISENPTELMLLDEIER